jgi:non-ribosomal peptide synthase protein (TIGR01720 family)
MHWLHDRGGSIGRFHQAMLLRVPGGVERDDLTAALQVLLAHHDALRLRTKDWPGSSDWAVEVAPREAVSAGELVRQVSIAGLDEPARQACIAEQVEAAAGRLDPAAGVMVQAVWFNAGSEQSGLLLLAIHHLAVDGVSWRLLIPDLEAAWQAVRKGEQPKLGSRGTSFRKWAEHLVASAHDPKRIAELPLWTSLLSGPDPVLGHRPLDPTRDTIGTVKRMHLVLPTDVTASLLRQVPALFHCRVNDVLLTAFALAIAAWRRRHAPGDRRTVLINVEGHGREEAFAELDVSRTVGWFTSLFPVRLEVGSIDLGDALEGGADMGRALKQIKEQLRALPDNGIGYGLLRYLNGETAKALASLPAPQICFNYLGRFAAPADQDWAPSAEGGVLRGGGDREMPLAHAIELSAITRDLSDGPELSANWSWAGELFSEGEIEELAQGWFRALRSLVCHALRPDTGGLTPSDLPLVSLDQGQIEQLERMHAISS